MRTPTEDEACVPVATLEQGLQARPDLVVVATPTSLHIDIAAAAVGAGIPVLVEKPLDAGLVGVDQLLERVRALRSTRVHRLHPTISSHDCEGQAVAR